MRGLATHPEVHPGAFSGQKQRWKTPNDPAVAVHCFYVCSGSVLLGDLGEVNMSVERDFYCATLCVSTVFAVARFLSVRPSITL